MKVQVIYRQLKGFDPVIMDVKVLKEDDPNGMVYFNSVVDNFCDQFVEFRTVNSKFYNDIHELKE